MSLAPKPAAQWSSRALLTPGSLRLALLVMIGSVFFPVEGLGVDLCPVHSLTGLPCPGCGLSRAIAAWSQGEVSAALGLNPFVVFAWPLFFVLALLALAPASVLFAAQALLERHALGATAVYRVVLFAFVGFGVARFATLLALGERFP